MAVGRNPKNTNFPCYLPSGTFTITMENPLKIISDVPMIPMYRWYRCPCIVARFPSHGLSRYRRATHWLHCGSAGESPGKHHGNSVETGDAWWVSYGMLPPRWAKGIHRPTKKGGIDMEFICLDLSVAWKLFLYPWQFEWANWWISGSGFRETHLGLGWLMKSLLFIPCFWDDQALQL